VQCYPQPVAATAYSSAVSRITMERSASIHHRHVHDGGTPAGGELELGRGSLNAAGRCLFEGYTHTQGWYATTHCAAHSGKPTWTKWVLPLRAHAAQHASATNRQAYKHQHQLPTNCQHTSVPRLPWIFV